MNAEEKRSFVGWRGVLAFLPTLSLGASVLLLLDREGLLLSRRGSGGESGLGLGFFAAGHAAFSLVMAPWAGGSFRRATGEFPKKRSDFFSAVLWAWVVYLTSVPGLLLIARFENALSFGALLGFVSGGAALFLPGFCLGYLGAPPSRGMRDVSSPRCHALPIEMIYLAFAGLWCFGFPLLRILALDGFPDRVPSEIFQSSPMFQGGRHFTGASSFTAFPMTCFFGVTGLVLGSWLISKIPKLASSVGRGVFFSLLLVLSSWFVPGREVRALEIRSVVPVFGSYYRDACPVSYRVELTGDQEAREVEVRLSAGGRVLAAHRTSVPRGGGVVLEMAEAMASTRNPLLVSVATPDGSSRVLDEEEIARPRFRLGDSEGLVVWVGSGTAGTDFEGLVELTESGRLGAGAPGEFRVLALDPLSLPRMTRGWAPVDFVVDGTTSEDTVPSDTVLEALRGFVGSGGNMVLRIGSPLESSFRTGESFSLGSVARSDDPVRHLQESLDGLVWKRPRLLRGPVPESELRSLLSSSLARPDSAALRGRLILLSGLALGGLLLVVVLWRGPPRASLAVLVLVWGGGSAGLLGFGGLGFPETGVGLSGIRVYGALPGSPPELIIDYVCYTPLPEGRAGFGGHRVSAVSLGEGSALDLRWNADARGGRPEVLEVPPEGRLSARVLRFARRSSPAREVRGIELRRTEEKLIVTNSTGGRLAEIRLRAEGRWVSVGSLRDGDTRSIPIVGAGSSPSDGNPVSEKGSESELEDLIDLTIRLMKSDGLLSPVHDPLVVAAFEPGPGWIPFEESDRENPEFSGYGDWDVLPRVFLCHFPKGRSR